MNAGKILMAAMLACACGSPSMSAPSKSEVDKLLDTFTACQTLPDATQKLACFQTHLNELKAIRERSGPLVAEREQRPARAAFSPITATLVSATDLLDGQWLLVLSDRSLWRTQDVVRFEPRRGDKVLIGKGALGSYEATIGNQRSVKARPLR